MSDYFDTLTTRYKLQSGHEVIRQWDGPMDGPNRIFENTQKLLRSLKKKTNQQNN